MMHHAFNFGLGQDPGPNQGPGLGNGGGQIKQQQWNLQGQNRSKYLQYNSNILTINSKCSLRVGTAPRPATITLSCCFIVFCMLRSTVTVDYLLHSTLSPLLIETIFYDRCLVMAFATAVKT